MFMIRFLRFWCLEGGKKGPENDLERSFHATVIVFCQTAIKSDHIRDFLIGFFKLKLAIFSLILRHDLGPIKWKKE